MCAGERHEGVGARTGCGSPSSMQANPLPAPGEGDQALFVSDGNQVSQVMLASGSLCWLLLLAHRAQLLPYTIDCTKL